MMRPLLLLSATLWLCNLGALGQGAIGSIEGWIADSAGEAVYGVNIVAQSSGMQGIRGVTTDGRGYFGIQELPPGGYSLRISHISYRAVTIEGIRVALGRTTGLGKLVLHPTTVAMDEVTTWREKPILDPSSSTVGANLRPEDLEPLPIERNYRSLVSILPQVNSSPFGDEANVGGATGTENRYYINGADVTDAFRGSTGMNLPYNFIKEVEVKVGGYEPEYQSSLGGIVNVITRSGSNEFHGTVFGSYTGNNFSGTPQVAANAPTQGAYSRYDLGVGIGGAILLDRLWYYAAYSPNTQRQDVQIPGFGYYPDKGITHSFAGKLSWMAGRSIDVSATVLGDPTVRNGVGVGFYSSYIFPSMGNPDPALKDVRTGGYAAILDTRWIATNDLLLQAMASWTTRKEKYWPSTPVGLSQPLVGDVIQGSFSGGSGERIDINTTSLTLSATGTLSLGSHVLKGGLRYEDLLLDSQILFSYLELEGDSTYLYQESNQSGRIRSSMPSVFMQDSWAVSQRLRLNAGLRWDGYFLVGSKGNIMQRILGQYQPRVGFVFLPGDGESQRIFGSFGRFYENPLMYASTVYFIEGTYQAGFLYENDPRTDPLNPDTLWNISGVQPEIDGLRGQFYDEFSLGYEQLFGGQLKGTVRAIYRTLQQILEDGSDPPETGKFYFGNPSRSPLATFPQPQRQYMAFEVSFEKSIGKSLYLNLSYILSRNYGNYVGLYDHDYLENTKVPNAGVTWDRLENLKDATGLLPNNRTHVIKLIGSYRFEFGLTIGTFFFWGSGTPLNDFGTGEYFARVFLRPRGTAGSSPAVWDLNIRLAYDPPWWSFLGMQPRFVLDLFHVGSRQTPLTFDQWHYRGQDVNGNQTTPNPYYGMPLSFQPPMSVRLGMEVDF